MSPASRDRVAGLQTSQDHNTKAGESDKSCESFLRLVPYAKDFQCLRSSINMLYNRHDTLSAGFRNGCHVWSVSSSYLEPPVCPMDGIPSITIYTQVHGAGVPRQYMRTQDWSGHDRHHRLTEPWREACKDDETIINAATTIISFEKYHVRSHNYQACRDCETDSFIHPNMHHPSNLRRKACRDR